MNRIKNKRYAKPIILTLSVIIFSVLLIFGVYVLTYSLQCLNITADEKAVMLICEDEENFAHTKITYANFLKSKNNGYADYSYYDICTTGGNQYIVEIRDTNLERIYVHSQKYTNMFNRKILLHDLITYRSSNIGTLSDRIGNTH